VFAHGFAVTPEFYREMLQRWAAAGYVVVAPIYPILSGQPGGASHVDYVETFGDTRFVITRVLALTGRSDPLLGGLVDPKHIAVTGHSDGETIAFAIGFLQCCRDARVSSVIAMAGDLSNANNPHERDSGVPIMHVMETGDEYDPYGPSIAWDRTYLDDPRWLLTLVGATHAPPYTRVTDRWFPVLVDATIAFLDGTLKVPERLAGIDEVVDGSGGAAQLER
jgi:dienelactone hydrolase